MGQIINQFPGGGEDVTAEVEVQTPLVDQIMTALIGKVGDDANATAETILEGYKAWVQGQKITGTMTQRNSESGYFTVAESVRTITFTHNLGTIPSKVILLKVNENGDFGLIQNSSGNLNFFMSNGTSSYSSVYSTTTTSNTFMIYGVGINWTIELNETTVTVTNPDTAATTYSINGTYRWVVIE